MIFSKRRQKKTIYIYIYKLWSDTSSLEIWNIFLIWCIMFLPDHNYTRKVFFISSQFSKWNITHTHVLSTCIQNPRAFSYLTSLYPLLTFVIVTSSSSSSSSWQRIHLIIHRTRVVIGRREVKSSVPADYSKPGRQRRPEGWHDALRSSESPWNRRYVNEILYSLID